MSMPFKIISLYQRYCLLEGQHASEELCSVNKKHHTQNYFQKTPLQNLRLRKSKLTQQKLTRVDKPLNEFPNIKQSRFKLRRKSNNQSKVHIQHNRRYSVALKPLPEHSSKILNQLSQTKDKSFFNTKSIDNGNEYELQQIFYHQVKFIQKCKNAIKK